MKKQLIILVVAALLVAVGLSGCSDRRDEEVTRLTIKEIIDNPDTYLNTNVTIDAKYNFQLKWIYTIDDDTGSLPVKYEEGFNRSKLNIGGLYRFSGTIVYDNVADFGEQLCIRLTKAVSLE